MEDLTKTGLGIPRVDEHCIGIRECFDMLDKIFYLNDMPITKFKDIVLAFLVGNGYDVETANMLSNNSLVALYLNSRN